VEQHEHRLTLLADGALNASGYVSYVPIRFCVDCGTVVFEFEKRFVMVPEWSREKLKEMKEKFSYIGDPPRSVIGSDTHELAASIERNRALGRGLKDLAATRLDYSFLKRMLTGKPKVGNS
jgi:hypothetical protein